MNTNLAFTIADACKQTGTGRTTLYEAIRTGNLRAVKNGRRTIILERDLQRRLESLPPITTLRPEPLNNALSPSNTTPQRDAKKAGEQ